MSYLGRIKHSIEELALLVEQNEIAKSDVHDRVSMLMENLAEYSAITDSEVNEVTAASLSAVMELVAAPVAAGMGRPAIDIPEEAVESYLLSGFKVQEIAELFGVSVRTIFRRMQNSGLRYRLCLNYSKCKNYYLCAGLDTNIRQPVKCG